jgi:nitrite reductase/ring-hydroxylating ferredoxin subunit
LHQVKQGRIVDAEANVVPREGLWLPPQYEPRLKVYASLLALLGILASGVAFVVVLVSFSWPSSDIGSPAALIYAGRVDDFEVAQPVRFDEGKFWLVKKEDGSFAALYWKDPHLGCTVPWRENFTYRDPRDGVTKTGWFRNPCHGETYDVYGVRIFGPSPRNLDQFPVEVVGDKVYVRATEDKIILGESPTPIY